VYQSNIFDENARWFDAEFVSVSPLPESEHGGSTPQYSNGSSFELVGDQWAVEMGRILRRHPQGNLKANKGQTPPSEEGRDNKKSQKKRATDTADTQLLKELGRRQDALEQTRELEQTARNLLDIELKSTRSKLRELQNEQTAARSSIATLTAELKKAAATPPPAQPDPAAPPATLSLEQAMEYISKLQAEHAALKATMAASTTTLPASTLLGLVPAGPSALGIQQLTALPLGMSTMQQPTPAPPSWTTMLSAQQAQPTFQLQQAACSPWPAPNFQLRPQVSFF